MVNWSLPHLHWFGFAARNFIAWGESHYRYFQHHCFECSSFRMKKSCDKLTELVFYLCPTAGCPGQAQQPGQKGLRTWWPHWLSSRVPVRRWSNSTTPYLCSLLESSSHDNARLLIEKNNYFAPASKNHRAQCNNVFSLTVSKEIILQSI